MKQSILIVRSTVASINDILQEVKFNKCLLVVGKYFHKLGLSELTKLDNVVTFDEISPNPTYEQICQGIDMFNRNNCDIIVTIGGGSVLDVAKAIKLFHKMSGETPYYQQEFSDTKVPIIAVPTTAGTGSESTKFTILVHNNEKVAVEHDSILPEHVVLNGNLLKDLSLYQKKSTFLDALAQAMESWWSVSSTKESVELSKGAIQLLMENYKEFFSTWSEEVACDIMFGSNLAGQAINLTKTTAPHAMSYKLTTIKGTAHGHAVAVCLPEIWEYMYNNLDKCSDKRGAVHLEQSFLDIAKMLGGNDIADGVQKFRDLLVELEIEKVTMTSEEIANISNSVNTSRLSNNPVTLTTEAIHEIYSAILL